MSDVGGHGPLHMVSLQVSFSIIGIRIINIVFRYKPKEERKAKVEDMNMNSLTNNAYKHDEY